MRLDFCKMTSSTGGTSTLTCSAQTGYPLVSEAFTGTIFVDYSITEYTSSAKTQLSKSETGIGSYNTSTEVLTRTKVLSTWDATDYLPKLGTATAPTALNFGTTSANIDIMVSPMAAGVIPPIPFSAGAVASVSDGLGDVGLNRQTISSTNRTLTSGVVYYQPLLWNAMRPISKWTFRSTTTLTGGTPVFDCSIYECGSDGFPGKQLISLPQIGSIGTTNTTYTSSAAGTPVYLVPGWYWIGLLYTANTASGTFSPRCDYALMASPGGTLISGTTPNGDLTVTGSLTDPATAPTGRVSNTAWPTIYLGN